MKSALGKLRKAAAFAAMSALALTTVPKDVSGAEGGAGTTTPIEHLVVIYQENNTFDHYFATYPRAENPPGEPTFHARAGTPSVNGLSGALLTNNPNSAQPFRLDRSQQITCDQNNLYTPDQQAYHAGVMDKFVEFTGSTHATTPPCEFGRGKNVVMGYYDGNTVTALWNYAQRFAMSDNSYATAFGPSTPGHINLVSGQTHGLDVGDIPNVVVQGTLIGNGGPRGDPCNTGSVVFMKTGRNVGDLLNDKGITWGWFSGGFGARNPDGSVNCAAQHMSVTGFTSLDYSSGAEPFQFYQSTRNPDHKPPSSVEMIGHTDQANHQYDLNDFWHAAESGNLPAVSFLKAARYQNGHPEYSDPLDEQTFLVNTMNRLQRLPEWRSTAVIIAYDDSDGWYDHVMPPIVNQSNTDADALTGPGSCGVAPEGAYQGRCGYGPRLPLLVISRWAKVNFVDHQITDQTSILRFIEDNWSLGRIGDQSLDEKAGSPLNLFDFRHPGARKVFLDSTTGEQMHEQGEQGENE